MYLHPPITEAVIGIQFTERISESDLLALKEKLSDLYPAYQPLENLNFHLRIDTRGDKGKTADTKFDSERAHRLGTRDMTELVVLQPKGFIVSQMAPYPGWEYFFGRFTRDWKLVRRVLGFREIARIGVRYINRIDIPSPNAMIDLESYLTIYPKVNDRFGPLTAYGVQAEVFMDDIRCKLLINSGAVPSPLLHTASFLVDIDVSRDSEVPQRDEGILSLISQIRARKNDVFESCVTDTARKLFENVK